MSTIKQEYDAAVAESAFKNIYPAEIEAICYHDPAVQEAAVFAVPDDALGEEAGACVVVKQGQDIEKAAERTIYHELNQWCFSKSRDWFVLLTRGFVFERRLITP
jgi:acyl-CoA synthetase (AMP-forming)/AMP-acid ligase II